MRILLTIVSCAIPDYTKTKMNNLIWQEMPDTCNQGTKASFGVNVFLHNSSVPLTCAIENPNDESDHYRIKARGKVRSFATRISQV